MPISSSNVWLVLYLLSEKAWITQFRGEYPVVKHLKHWRDPTFKELFFPLTLVPLFAVKTKVSNGAFRMPATFHERDPTFSPQNTNNPTKYSYDGKQPSQLQSLGPRLVEHGWCHTCILIPNSSYVFFGSMLNKIMKCIGNRMCCRDVEKNWNLNLT